MDLQNIHNRQNTPAKDDAFRSRLRSSRSTFVYERPYAKPGTDPEAARATPSLSQTTALTVAQLSRKMAASKNVVRAARTAQERPDLPRQHRSRVLQRHAMKKAAKKRYVKYHRPLMPTLFGAMAVVLFGFGLFAVFNSIKTDKLVQAQVGVLAAKIDDNSGITDGLPSETDPPADMGSYSVAADLPRYLSIDRLGVKARVRHLGVGENNVLKAPANIFDVGWYDGSAKPGDNGTVVMDGHVSGPTKRGVFNSIGTMKPSEKIQVERGDGQKFTYSVTGTQVYDNDKVDMSRLMTTSVPGKPGLNLITCTGRFNVRTNQFEQRVVVFAVQDE